jgi:hypothetical protein
MTAKTLPSPEYLRKRLAYDASTGQLVWKQVTPCHHLTKKACAIINKKYAGQAAASAVNAWGYRITRIQGRGLLAHRVAWAIYYGSWPNGELDHIDGDKLNNRITNLRDVDGTTNRRNMPRQRNNTSGVTGVNKNGNKWVARIGAGARGKRINLGAFESKEDAIAARNHALKTYKYGSRHGI